MSFWVYVSDRREQLLFETYQHASMVAQTVLVATALGILLAALAYRRPRLAALTTASTAAIMTVPSFALLGLLILPLGLGVAPTVTALVLYALLPIVRNGIVGLRGVDPALVDAARG
ncbi:MAG: ABC transporter permease subunit, partial [Actinomycetes bacterium]